MNFLFDIAQETRTRSAESSAEARMAEIDARDGSKDGKITPRVVTCRRCNRKISTARQRCMFCNELVLDGHLFEKT